MYDAAKLSPWVEMMRSITLLGCFFLLFSVGTSSIAAGKSCEQQVCVAVIDVGSTGSRIHIYSYDLDSTKTPVNITERWVKKISPGFATLTANQQTINNYLTSLFIDAPNYELPTYFYATAGMRLLSKPQQQLLYTYTQQWFANQTQWQLVNAKTITGTDEGIYGWLAVNYQLNNLTTNSRPIGVLDMGGASVQITFPITNESATNTNDLQQIDLYGQHYKLFVHSFLGLGQTEMSHQFLDSEACFDNNYEMPTGHSAQGDAYKCENEVSSLMNSVHQVNSIVQPVIKSNSINDWYTLGGLPALAQSKPFDFSEQQLTTQNLLEKANSDVCQQDWTTLNTQYSGNSYAYGYCLFPSYYYALIVDGYGLQPQQSLHYLSADKSGDWTLGVVLHQQA